MTLPLVFFAIALASSPNLEFKVSSEKETVSGQYSYAASIPQFKGSSALEKFANQELSLRRSSLKKDFMLSAQHEERSGSSEPYSFELGHVVSLAKKGFISVLLDHHEFSGGAHPNGFSHTFNLGTRDGKPAVLELEDILTDREGKREFLTKVVLPRVNTMKTKRSGEKLESLEAEMSVSFVVSGKYLTLIYDSYALGPYVEGAYVIKFAWSEISDWIDPKRLSTIKS